ncbi:YheT family hydrolase [Microscilla marina]|uniref:Alpha/beta hydrolase fold n=1 Tax=Microscilla marina ATCC 23134 TaxID=313606 RepID=A1ZM85_MICM2|nr:alpha/beta fold hydrolase [Microscilla marina]EAY28617.1 alpha/beta hydrolase fold [Microscilla marina ATCC 23134]
MPIIQSSSYKAPAWLPNRHWQTIYPNVFRTVKGVNYQRERIQTPDDDFLDLDWSKTGDKHTTRSLVILSHGLEGAANRTYMLGMAKAFNAQGWDALAWNLRGCSGEPNRTVKLYHHGITEDLDAVLKHVFAHYPYEKIALVGFSLGGNLNLKYLGEQGENLDSRIVKSVSFSTPCDLGSSAPLLENRNNWIYQQHFKKKLVQKIKTKSKLFPKELPLELLKKVDSLLDFIDIYLAPIHNFKNAEDYFNQVSACFFLDKIQIPSLIVNAINDSFLSPECSPIAQAQNHPYVFVENPTTGGHCGFPMADKQGLYWSEKRALEFVS